MRNEFRIQNSRLEVKRAKFRIFITYWEFKLNSFKKQREGGFTLPELIISMVIFSSLVGLVTINLTYAHRRATLNTVVTTIIGDFKEQQTKAIVGDTEGRATSDNYGMYFQANSYTLFHGTTYSPADTANALFMIDENVQIINPNYQVLFLRASGEVSGYNPATNTIVVRDTTNNTQKIIQYNRYGVITTVN